MREQMKNRNNQNPDKIIGRVPVHLTKEFRDFIDDKDHFEDSLTIRKKQMQMELEQKLKDEFSTRLESIELRHDQIWAKIYDALNIDPNGSYYFNRKTGQIVQRKEQNDDTNYSSPFNF
jgi:hypothetical protein